MLWWILLFSFLGSVGSVILCAVLLLARESVTKKVTPYVVAYATGTMLAAGFLAIIPHVSEEIGPVKTMTATLFGILGFFLLEKFLLWRHCHQAHCPVHSAAGALVLVGDGFHNFVDGVVIAAAFLTSFHMGVGTSIAVIAHEIPQEIGDFAILLDSGYGRMKAFLLNVLSGAAGLLGAVLAYALLGPLDEVVPYVMTVAASSFIYIALADLVPARRQPAPLVNIGVEFALILLGVGTIMLFHHH